MSTLPIKLPELVRVHVHLCGDSGLYRFKTSEKDRINRAEIAYCLEQLGKYGTRSWRISPIIQNASRSLIIEWVQAFSHDDDYTPAS